MLLPLSASHAHSLANLRKTPDEVVHEIARIRDLRDARAFDVRDRGRHQHRVRLHDPGPCRADEVLRLVQAVLDAGAERVGLADTVGYADPLAVRALFEQALPIAGERLACGHFHDTRGLGLANVYGGLGGGHRALRCVPRRHRRLPARAGRERQRRDRRRRVPVREHGRRDGAGLRSADRAAREGRAVAGRRNACTARCGAPGCRRRCWRLHDTQHLEHANDNECHADAAAVPQPLAGLRVVEFTHMVMGPTCGMVLADMGAEVIKVEPIDGDRTRRLLGAGAGFFPMFNRNKKSIAIDLRNPAGVEVGAPARGAAPTSWPRTSSPARWSKYGLDYATLSQVNPRADLRRPQGLSARDRTTTAPRSTRSCR